MESKKKLLEIQLYFFYKGAILPILRRHIRGAIETGLYFMWYSKINLIMINYSVIVEILSNYYNLNDDKTAKKHFFKSKFNGMFLIFYI